jgi:E3 ubiquitin-protein ligase RBBP6
LFFVDVQWKTPQDFAAESYMMPYGPAAFNNPYWAGMQPGMDGYMAPGYGVMPYTGGYGLGPFDMPFGGIVPQDPFGGQGYMFPHVPPQRYALVMSFPSCSLSLWLVL